MAEEQARRKRARFERNYDNYLNTLEGQKLPVPHCIDGTYGHELNAEIKEALKGKEYKDVIKAGFGSFSISKGLKDRYPGEEMEVEFVGLCTDICVVSNALRLNLCKLRSPKKPRVPCPLSVLNRPKT